MNDLGMSLFEGISEIAIPYFRGYYSDAEKSAQRLVVKRQPHYYGRLFRGIAAWVSEHNTKKALQLLDTVLADLSSDTALSDTQRRAYYFYIHLCKAWVSSTTRNDRDLRLAINEARLAREIFAEAETKGETLTGLWMLYDSSGWACYHLGQTAQAIEELNLAIRAVNNWVESRLGFKYENPVYSRREIRENIPNFARTMTTRGLYFFELGDFESALEDMEIALEIDPENSYCRAYKGIVLWAMNKTNAALEEMKKACDGLIQGADIKSTGRIWYYRALFCGDVLGKASETHILPKDVTTPMVEEFFDKALEGFSKTYRCRDAICTAILRLVLLNCKHKSKESAAAAMMLWELLSAFEGADDYVGSYLTNQTKGRNYLLKTSQWK